jgi:hypothetical protein
MRDSGLCPLWFKTDAVLNRYDYIQGHNANKNKPALIFPRPNPCGIVKGHIKTIIDSLRSKYNINVNTNKHPHDFPNQ